MRPSASNSSLSSALFSSPVSFTCSCFASSCFLLYIPSSSLSNIRTWCVTQFTSKATDDVSDFQVLKTEDQSSHDCARCTLLYDKQFFIRYDLRRSYIEVVNTFFKQVFFLNKYKLILNNTYNYVRYLMYFIFCIFYYAFSNVVFPVNVADINVNTL